jgi:transposase InsO family protein
MFWYSHLPIVRSKKYVLVMVDFLTRYVEASILTDVPTAEEVMDLFLRKIILRHGCIGTLVTDPGSEFINNVAQDVCERLYVKHVPTPTDDHRANGLCERFMRTLS